MGTGTRDRRSKQAMALCKEDKIVVAGSAEPHIPADIPTRREWIKLTDRLTEIK